MNCGSAVSVAGLWVLAVLLQCPSSRGAPPHPSGGSYVTGDLWLEGGNAPGTGTLLIYYNGGWGFVCDDGWTLEAAEIACRTLGYPRALGETVEDDFNYAKTSELPILLDDVQCFGDESSLLDCRHTALGVHDCHRREAAGVFCAPNPQGGVPTPRRQRPTPTATSSSTSTSTSTSTTSTAASARSVSTTPRATPKFKPSTSRRPFNSLFKDALEINSARDQQTQQLRPRGTSAVVAPPAPLAVQATSRSKRYKVRIVNGRNPEEGRVEVKVGYGKWGTICSDTWGLLESTVACKQAGKGHARNTIRVSFFGGENLPKVAAGLKCTGEESSLHECTHEQFGDNVRCPRSDLVAGVICTDALPDLVPNATLLEKSSYLEDRMMVYLQCAMEENCASSSAFRIKAQYSDWQYHRRRLLRFSSSTWNFGTADFRPQQRKEDWDWHLCHMHYHSMDVFAHYDLLATNGTRVAEGHKASFCLEDVQCKTGTEKKYACKGFGDQGISVNCADDYLHDIDCQWIDVTDVEAGSYTFRVHINPEFKVAELNYSNNAVHCDLLYTGVSVLVSNCQIGRVPLTP